MFWNDEDEIPIEPQSDVVDVVFLIKGKSLPNDALSAIAQCLSEQIEEWDTFDNIGLHVKLGGEEGNGWYRDSDPESVLYISRRTKLIIRAGKDVLANVQALNGSILDVQGHVIELTHKHNKKLSSASTLYCQHIVSEFKDETEFLMHAKSQLEKLEIHCQKILCGKSRELHLLNRKIITRSLMLNDLSKENSLLLQAQGLGDFQKFGCGVFVPYKSIS